MNQPLRPAFLCAIAAAIVLGIAKDMSLGTIMFLGIELNQSAMNNIGVVLVIMGFAWGTPAVFDRLIGSAWAFGDIIPKILHKEVALLHAQKDLAKEIKDLDPDQLAALLNKSSKVVLIAGGWEIKGRKGRLVSSDKFSQYLYKCENHNPVTELPAVTRNNPGSTVREDEEAIISFLEDEGFCEFRSGQRYFWIYGNTPETVREVYFDK